MKAFLPPARSLPGHSNFEGPQGAKMAPPKAGARSENERRGKGEPAMVAWQVGDTLLWSHQHVRLLW